MENVTDQVSNPFGMRPPCPCECAGGDGRRAVFGYGDANADFHVIGDHPGVHGGARSGVPFTGDEAGERVLDALEAVGLVTDRTGSDDGSDPELRNCFLSYLHLCCVPPGETPGESGYAEFERFFDAELRAISAHVLLPVGRRATGHVLEEYTARARRLGRDMDRLHATQVKGRGFLVLPIREPSEWGDEDFGALVAAIRELLGSEYHQTVDLGRFGPTGEPYFVR